MILLKITTFLKSLWFHVAAGLPKSTQEEINRRFYVCKGCDYFNGTEMICNHCGCSIGNRKIFMNKLAWADQECQIGKWHKITRSSHNENN